MLRYFIRRLLLLIPIILCVTLIVFALMYFLPGSTTSSLPSDGGGDALDAIFEFFGAKDGFVTKYIRYCWNVFTKLEFGSSNRRGNDIGPTIFSKLPRTLLLAVLSVAVICLVGPPLGIFAAIHHNTAKDSAIMTLALVGASIPPYVLGLLLMMLFTLALNWLPAAGYGTVKHIIMPVMTLSIGGVATIARVTRSCMLETMDHEYIVTARAKGLRERLVIYKHALKNAVIPVITVLGSQLGQLVGGAIVVEYVFTYSGLGMYLMDAISSRNQLVVQGCVVVLAALVGLINIISDVAYAYANPQIRAKYIDRGRVSRRRKRARDEEAA